MLSAAEVAVFADGSRAFADRHRFDGMVYRFYSPEGERDVPASWVQQIDRVEERVTPDMFPVPAISAELPVLPQFPRKAVDPHTLAHEAATRHGISPAFVKSIMAAESAFNPKALSPKGAVGLMQVMPQTAQQFGLDPTVPYQDVDAGTQYLKMLLDKYRGYRNMLSRVIAAYNAGPGAVDRYRGVPPYPETKSYVARVLAYFRQFQRDHQ
jgi:soluble lytic murein transglycosylase-like protein